MEKPFCLQNVAEHVDIFFLRSFQSVILQRQSLITEFGSKKTHLLNIIEKLNRECYGHELQLLSSYGKLGLVLEGPGKVPRKLLCTNEKEYLGSAYLYIMRVLLMLREDVQVFQYLIRILDNSRTLSGKFLDSLAEDLVFLFFTDFSSTEKNVISILRQLEGMIMKLFKYYVKGERPLLFEEQDLMVNRIIKAFLNKYEHREYLSLLFGKLFDEATDLRKYLKTIKQKKPNEIPIDGASTPHKNTEDEGPSSLYSPTTRFIADHFSGSFNIELIKAPSTPEPKAAFEEAKIVASDADSEKLTTDDILLICEGIFNRITKKLPYMPLSMRYFCKLLEKIALQYNDPQLSPRKLIMDILFNKWWLHALMKPSENGLLKNCETEHGFITQLKPVVKVLKSVFYEKPIDGLTSPSAPVKAFILAKKGMVEEYLAELLAVELPSLDMTEADKDTLIVSSVCMSVENIKFIHELMQENIEEVKQIKESFSKYVGRVQFFVENKDSTTLYSDIFQPTEKSFQCITLDGRGLPSKEEFMNAGHYILFQDIHVNELRGDDIALVKWQHCLVNLLLETDLTSYCSKLANEATASQNEKTLTELFWQIHKSPTGFLVDLEKAGRVKVMAYFLARYFQTTGGEDAMKELEVLRNYFQVSVDKFLERQQNMEQSLRLTINSLNNRITNIKTETNRYNTDVFQCIMARRFIAQYACTYEIQKIAINTIKVPDKRRCSVIIKADSGKYIINFIELDKKAKSSKRKTIPSSKSQRLVEFLDEYAQFIDVTRSITMGADQCNICGMFNEYFGRIRAILFTVHPETVNLSIEDKEGIFGQIYDYAMLRLYTKIFPEIPSVEDQHLSNQLKKLQNLPPEHFEIKAENRHVELWDLAIKRLKKVDKMQTPKSKLNALTDAYKLVVDSIEVFSRKKEGAGAEDSMPVLVYLYANAELNQMISTLNYIELFGTHLIRSQALGEYCYRAVKGVVAHLRDYNVEGKKTEGEAGKE